MGAPIPRRQCLCRDLQRPRWEGATEAGVGAEGAAQSRQCEESGA